MQHEWEPGHELPDDSARRFRDFEAHEHVDARRERDFDCHPDPKPLRRAWRSERQPAGVLVNWKHSVLDRDQGCRVHADPAACELGWQAHHVVPQQELRRSHPAALWNPLSGMTVCGLAHRQHHNRTRPILLDEIPEPVFDYLRGLGFAPYLERHYPASGEPQHGRQA